MLTPALPLQLKLSPPLEPDFTPAALFNHIFRLEAEASRKTIPVALAIERTDGTISRLDTRLFDKMHPWSEHNYLYVERMLKFLLWQRGGWKAYIGGASEAAAYLQALYSAQGGRNFDYRFMGETVYQHPFRIVDCSIEATPAARESQRSLGRHLEGCRIGFDLGASDVKVSAVIDGEAVFTHEMEWNPRDQADPQYHYEKITRILKMAADKLPRVDAIGGSSAGVIINNRPMVASLFRGVPKERFDEVHELFLRIRQELGVPMEVVNDGEVSALAGSMSMGQNAVLGLAMGSSLAAGYVTPQGNITNWLNELAFAPIDYNPVAPVDEWSGDRGVGAQYMSQQCVFRLAPAAGIAIPEHLSLAQKLRFVQDRLEAGHAGARQIWESIGVFLGYAIAHYADFYDLETVQILGRVTSGLGGKIILEGARQVLQAEFPEVFGRAHIELPDELSRRLGQSIAAASLPALDESPI